MVESDPQIKHLFEISFRLEGLTRHASKHAAGVVIAPRPLREMIPLYTPAKSDESVTQFAMTELDQLGFLKMDFLGLKNLTIIDRTVRAIKRNHGIDIDLDKIPLNDDATFELLCAGNCSGVFQFEGDGVTEVIKRLKPDKFEDLIAVNALYRPGPLGSGMVDDFIDRRHGKKKVSYMFSELAPILEETYGVIVYQEQVQKIASVIGGYSLGGADILRRAMGKKKPEEMARQRKIFLEGAKKNGFNEKKADELFELMAYFAGYGFNKSHSAAYALIAYQTAYLKANYPREFIASLLSFEVNNPDQFALYLQRSQALGIPIIAPDINSSDIEFRATPEGIIFGLEGVKNVGLSALENIIASRESGPFKSLADFCERIDLRTVNKRVIESLISAGAFDALDGTRAQKMYDLEAVIKYTHDKKEAARTGQMGLFGAHSPANPDESDEFRFSQVPPWTTHETLEREKQSIGIYLSDHPLTEYQPLADALGARALKHDPEEPSKKGESQVFLGILRKYKVIFTKKGDRMAFGELEDRDARVEVVIFPRIFEKHEELLDRQGPLIIQGNAESTPSNSMKIIAEKIMAADQVMMDQAHLLESITLTLPKKFSEQTCQSLNKLLSEGNHSFNIMFSENEKALTLAANKKIQISLELLKKLNQQNISVRISLKQPPAKKPFKGPPGYA
jgi:DNA polymerase-3 subunit alpha